MSSTKCSQCGLVNWAYEETCKRCGATLYQLQETPPAFKWFTAYCLIMAFMYLGLVVMGFVFLAAPPTSRDMDATEAAVMSTVFIVMGLLFFAPFAAGPFLPRKGWAWIFGLVLICIGLTSACCLPVCIPLLVFWLKPEMKAFYGRTGDRLPPPPPKWS